LAKPIPGHLIDTVSAAIDVIEDLTPAFPPSRAITVRALVPHVAVITDTLRTNSLNPLRTPWTPGCYLNPMGSPTITQTFAIRLRGNLHLDTGIKTVLVRSDDGFQLSIGRGAGALTMEYRDFRDLRSDSRRFLVQQPGVYPFELVYFDRNLGSALEVLLSPGERCFASDGSSAACDAGGFDLNNFQNPVNTSGFEVLDSTRLAPASWAGVEDRCLAELGQPNRLCQGAPSCGDGVVDMTDAGLEVCDDGNRDGGDGCTSVCTIETGFQCSRPPAKSFCTLTAPTITEPSVGARLSTSRPTFSGSGVPGLTVIASLDGGLFCVAPVAATALWSCTVSTSVPDGPSLVTALHTDDAGRRSTGVSVAFAVATLSFDAGSSDAGVEDGGLSERDGGPPDPGQPNGSGDAGPTITERNIADGSVEDGLGFPPARLQVGCGCSTSTAAWLGWVFVVVACRRRGRR
jgi:cysteine-rich repeat protein